MTDEILLFVACEERYCQTIPIINDNEVENDKTFRVTLNRTDGLDSRVTISTPRARADITIYNDDGMCHNAPGVLVHTLIVKYSFPHQLLQCRWRVQSTKSQRMKVV